MARKLKQPTFETERLRLRPFRTSDAKALHALYGDVDNLRYWGVDPSPADFYEAAQVVFGDLDQLLRVAQLIAIIRELEDEAATERARRRAIARLRLDPYRGGTF